MKKKVLSMFLASAMALSVVACGSSNGGTTDTQTASNDAAPKQESTTTTTETKTETAAEPEVASELTDGKFADTRQITVEIYDRGNDGGSDPENNMYTEYIKKGMLEEHNVEVTFKKVPRWTEVDDINNLLAAGEAPDICVTYSYPTVLTYAQMGGVIDLQDLIEQYKADTPNLWNWLGEQNMLWDKDPKTGEVWALEGRRAEQQRIVTFVRQDWLDALNMKAPTTTQEFEDMLVAFRDNADTLLGKDAKKMVPFSVSYDVGWRAALLIESEISPDITDKEFYINGFDDRKLTENGTKEAIRTLNKWYNEGLLWKDFALYGSGDTTEDDMMKAGYVGAFQHNWDYPFRNGEDSIQANLKRLVGENAKYVAVDCFENAAGKTLKFGISEAGDRKIFFPSTNDEPLASMLYLDWISDPEHIQYLQIGDEGVTHNVLDDGAIEIIAAEGDAIMNSGQNIDYTITCNGLHFTDDKLTELSMAHSYACVDSADVETAIKLSMTNPRYEKNVKVAQITAEDGMGEALASKRDEVYDTAVVAAADAFDTTWDKAMADYLSAGGQAIIDERTTAWEAAYGSATSLD